MFEPTIHHLHLPTKNKCVSPNSHTFQHIYKGDIQKYHGILLQRKIQKQNAQIWKDTEEKDTVPINQFIQEEIHFV